MEQVRVKRVIDADTIVLDDEDETHIRLFGIDAPEKRQEWGPEASEFLREFLKKYQNRDMVFVDIKKTLTYGRHIGKVFVGGPKKSKRIDVSLELIRTGNAWAYDEYLKKKDPEREVYLNAQKIAMAGKKGLWINPNAIRPSEFRHPKQVGLSCCIS